MASQVFNIFGKLKEEIDDFENEGVWIIGKPDSKHVVREKRGERGGYYFSQKDTLDAVDLADASKFKKGIWDDEGQRKTYLNIVSFYRDVMKMKININVANYILTPTSHAWTWAVWLFDRMFKLWASNHDYDDQIDEFAHDLSTYGTCVSLRATDCTERVALRTIRNTQTAKTLYQAAANGGYVILDKELHYNRIKEMPDWSIDHLSKFKSYQVFMRFGLVPTGLIQKWATMTDQQIAQYSMKEEDELELAVAVMIQEGVTSNDAGSNGESLLFLEKLSEENWPLDECHVNKRDGRWLGVGEIEKQLENQLSRNINANFRRRGILWAAKKVFQSSDEDVQQNLVYEVQDGEVLHVKQNGTITQVNTANQHSAEITADDQAVDDNSQKRAFAFEVATGESLPSGTPFRLGVVLSTAVSSHFKLVQETFSRFLKRAFFHEIIPLFKEEYYDEHEAQIPLDSDDIDAFRNDILNYHTNMRLWDGIIGHKAGTPWPNKDAIRMQVETEFAANDYAFLSMEKGFYEHAEWYMKLNLTDDIGPDIADLTSLYQTLMQQGDTQRAENVLGQIFALRGKALPAILGAQKPTQGPIPAPTGPNGAPVPLPSPSPIPAPTA